MFSLEQASYDSTSSLIFSSSKDVNTLSAILQSVQDSLVNFSRSDAAVGQMVSLFENARIADVESLLSSWRVGDFSALPEFAVLSDVNMRGALGAFASESNTAYLSDRLISQSAVQLDPITGGVGVAIEEIGHSIDALLNPMGDTQGDEGDLFKAAVLDLVLSDEEKSAIAHEDDTGTVIVNDRSVVVEQATRRGNSANNTLKGTSAADYLYGKSGSDKLYGYSGDDKLYGGTGDDKLYSGSGDDRLSGWKGDDYLSGWSGNDKLYGGSGNDKLYGGSGDDRLSGSSGDDRLSGSSGDDLLYGGSGNDKLYGGSDNDYLSGWKGNDYLSGWKGDDVLKGYGKGSNERDTLRGGTGRDTFLLGDIDDVYYTNSGNADYATLDDLAPTEDTVQLHQLNNSIYSPTRAYGYRLQAEGDNTWFRHDSDGQAIALIENQTNLSLLSDTFSYIGKADLALSQQSIPSTVYTDGSVAVNVTTKNQGVATASVHTLSYWLSDSSTFSPDSAQLLGTNEVSALAHNTSENNAATFSYDAAWGMGTKYIIVQADSGKDVSETNEDNNIIYHKIEVVAPIPDLSIGNVSVQDSALFGSAIAVTASVNNETSLKAGASRVQYWLSDDTNFDPTNDQLLGFRDIGEISANASETTPFRFIHQAEWGYGTKYIFIEADGYNQVEEYNESNNITFESITIAAPSFDLTVLNQQAPTSVKTNQQVTIEALIQNLELGTANSSYIRYWLSDNESFDASIDRLLGENYVSWLAQNATESDSLTFTYDERWGIGSKHIFFQVDAQNSISEIDEDNNLVSQEINVTASEAEAPITYQPFDASKVFALGSRESANHTIYLDFNGHTTKDLFWNRDYNDSKDIVSPQYDIDGNQGEFSLTERENIWRIWQRVSEDFSPFDVNVTTAEPDAEDLIKSADSSDRRWGTRIVIGGDSDDWFTENRPGKTIGGIAAHKSFSDAEDTPSFVFSDYLGRGNDVRWIGEAVTHELGHTLGLRHDGHDGHDDHDDHDHETHKRDEYYDGHGSGATGWGAIMGSSPNALIQWSKGEYDGATQQQDDLAIIAGELNGFGYRNDDHADNYENAKPLFPYIGAQVKAYGIIEKNTDSDWFSFTTAAGQVNLTFDVFEQGANLDILVELYDHRGQALNIFSNPIDELSAFLDRTLNPGKYYIKVSGTGKDGVDGYSDYGSLGQYAIAGTIA